MYRGVSMMQSLSSLRSVLFNEDGMRADHPQYQIERILEITFLLTFIIFSSL